jgi:hypothetical protein
VALSFRIHICVWRADFWHSDNSIIIHQSWDTRLLAHSFCGNYPQTPRCGYCESRRSAPTFIIEIVVKPFSWCSSDWAPSNPVTGRSEGGRRLNYYTLQETILSHSASRSSKAASQWLWRDSTWFLGDEGITTLVS